MNSISNSIMSKRRLLSDTAVRAALAVGLFAAFPKFSDLFLLWLRQGRLETAGFGGPSNYEYPPLAAVYWWPFSQLPSPTAAVVANAVAMGLFAIAVTWVLVRLANSEEMSHLRMWAASPTLIFFLPINWDAVVVLLMMLGVAALIRHQETAAASWLAAGTAMKVFPAAVALPVLPLLRSTAVRIRFLASAVVVGGGIYAFDIFVLRPDGWRLQFEYARERVDIEATIWGGVDWLVDRLGGALSISTISMLALVTTAGALIALTFWSARHRPGLYEISALSMTAFLILNKTYKPQYILWLLPLLALSQVARMPVLIAEIAVIIDFATYHFDLPGFVQPITVLVRTLALLLIGWGLMRRSASGPRGRARADLEGEGLAG